MSSNILKFHSFQDFINETSPIDIEFDNNPSTDDKLCIFTHLKTWIHGTVKNTHPLWVHVEVVGQVIGGTSGSAVVNQSGKAVAVVSVISDSMEDESSPGSYGSQPLIQQCLAKFLYDAIHSSQRSSKR